MDNNSDQNQNQRIRKRLVRSSRITTDEFAANDNLKDDNKNIKRQRCFKVFAVVFGFLFVTLYVIFPLLIWFFPFLMKEVVFLSILHWPPFVNLNNTAYFGLNAARSFMVHSEDVSLGVWHIPPKSLIPVFEKNSSSAAYDGSLAKSGYPVLLYFHGNTGTRAKIGRISSYNYLIQYDFHIIAFDYRGFGDSPGYTSEETMVKDGKIMFDWVREKVGSLDFYVWAHSLGTGVATRMMRELNDAGLRPKGLILEAPFNNVRDAAASYPLSIVYRYLPYFEPVFLDAIGKSGVHFQSDEHINHITVPTLIMHGEDDEIIPISQSKKLYSTALKHRPKEYPPIKYVQFDASERCGHFIYRSAKLIDVLRSFMDSIK